jgi:murein L,D-transpeptidase YafK
MLGLSCVQPRRLALALAAALACQPDAYASPAADPQRPHLRRWVAERGDDALSGPARERRALINKGLEVAQLLRAAGVEGPPKQLHFRVFKQEQELEVWASGDASGPLKLVATYEICATSGQLGPKLRQGDGQVPEGFYEIDFFKPRSDYYLAMRINYPNARDRAIGATGSAIMIHGRCASIGCLAMTDPRIEELWVLARALAKGRVHVHIFPMRDIAPLLEVTTDPALHAFWSDLDAGKRAFEADHQLPRVRWDSHGRYLFDAAIAP